MRSTLTLILTILATFCQGECPGECYCDRVTTCTGDKLLTRFPTIYYSSSGSEMTRLELHDYSVNYLRKGEVGQIISNLTELSLTRSSLQGMDNETFSLFNNSDQASSSFIFQLRILDLSQNKLDYFVGGGRLKRLRILDLSSNHLQQVYELSPIQRLESVNLRDNRISYLQPSTFQGLKYLQYINLDSNILGSVDPSTFSNLPALAHLLLSSNPISNLAPGFLWNSRVQFVDVSHVGLTSIPTSLTKSVRDFRCANNNLTLIRQTDFESYPNVGLLVLDENAIEEVEDDAFGRLDFLTRLWMNGNRLKGIPQNLPPSLQSLHLEDNRIVNISSTDFKNLRNLQELNLHGNKISSLPPFAFSELSSLKNLDLRSNEIDVIYKDSFSNLSKLQSLCVSQNPIKVIVTGAFGDLGKVSLLQFSRLMEPIEFDSISFSPLQKLQILEIDDSPHLAQKVVQSSALSHLSNLVELNLQRCGLQDLAKASAALTELNLQVVKMSGNPWDCSNLYGSGIGDLMSRGRVVDRPLCEQPHNLKGVPVSALNFSALSQSTTPSSPELEEGSEENLLDFRELTPELVEAEGELSYVPGISTDSPNLHSQLPISLDKVTNAPNTNSPENAPHALDANVNPFKSTTTSPAFSISDSGNQSSQTADYPGESGGLGKNLPTTNSNLTTTTKKEVNTATVAHNSIVSSSNSGVGGINRPVDVSQSEDKRDSILDLDAQPTKSYFDPGWKTNGISLSSSNGSKKAEISIPIEDGGRRTAYSDKTKTNDDNTIIDERMGREGEDSSSLGRYNNEEETGPKSIEADGFPSGFSDAPSQELPTSIASGKQPKAFYLRRGSNEGHHQSSDSSTTIIIKTLVISATVCLVSILFLLSLGYAIYRVSKRKSGSFFSSKMEAHSSGQSGNNSSSNTRMSYTRFGRRADRNCNQNLQDFDSDSDQVELSGITNRLYVENEEIYHIT